MLSLQHIVIQQVIDWLRDKQSCWLATITRTYGSSPRPVGSIMTCNQQGLVVGSLSGGCVEEALLKRIINAPSPTETPQFLLYQENNNEGPGALPCGGELELLIEPLQASHLPHFETLLNAIQERRPIQRQVTLANGEKKLLSRQQPALQLNESAFYQTFFPPFQILLIGITPVSLYLAEMANSLDFRVWLCDPREAYQANWQPEAYPYIHFCPDFPDDVVREHFNDAYSAVLALAHDPRIDDMALMEALLTPAFYVGAMGSQHSSYKRRARLLELGLNKEQIAHLQAPIGLPIGSKTPMEIAVSIAAELVLLRNKTLSRQQENVLTTQQSDA